MSIRLANINKTFNGFKALENINVEFPDGKLTALLGPSGSGKTTLLKLVAGLETPDEIADKKILFNEVDVSKSGVGQRQVGFVFQHYALFRHLSVFENIAFGLRVKKKTERPSNNEIKDKVHELLRLIQLESMANRLPSQLSGGQRQRVALARALAIEPQVLLLDEPFGALDAKIRAELRRWLRDLHYRLHFTSIFVTHDQEEALEVSDHIIVMNHGKIEQTGTPNEVFHNPANEFVMQFLGDVNVFHGRVDNCAGCDKTGNGSTARLLVRPHDFEIILISNGAKDLLPVTTHRVLTAGSVVKIEVIDDTGRRIQVHISHSDYNKTPVQPGQKVFLRPQKHTYYGSDNKDDITFVDTYFCI